MPTAAMPGHVDGEAFPSGPRVLTAFILSLDPDRARLTWATVRIEIRAGGDQVHAPGRGERLPEV